MINDLRALKDAYVTLTNGKSAIAVTTEADKSLTIPSINKWGHNDDIDIVDATAGQIIWPVKAATQQYKFLTSPVTGLNLQSSAAADILTSGTGAWTVEIIYHDENNIQQTVNVNLNGITPVPLAFSTVGIFRMTVINSGSGNINAGDITITDSGGDILCVISAGEGQTQIAVQKIPAGVFAVCKSHTVYFPGGSVVNTAILRLRVKRTDGTINTKWEPELTQYQVRDDRIYYTGGIRVNAGEWLYWTCINVGANNIRISASFDLDFFEEEV